ncbi:MAG: FG-GAP repeat protein [Thermoanaerobaculia bacterium]|nr:FG-GAP repeat protein [Thermoanaerobaculia bacterium]
MNPTHPPSSSPDPRAAVPLALLLVAGVLILALHPAAQAQIQTDGAQYFHQDSAFVPDTAEQNDFWGSSLVAGDFNGDGFADLAIGASDEDIFFNSDDAGQVTVIYGTEDGLDPAFGAEVWSRGQGLLTGSLGTDDHFGFSLASGDFNNDMISDLAISVHRSDVVWDSIETSRSGAVFVLYGSGTGLTSLGHQYLHKGTLGIPGGPVLDDSLGFTLSSGDFDGDGIEDLAMGILGHDGAQNDIGGVTLAFGSNDGLVASKQEGEGGRVWTLSDLGYSVSGNESWSSALAAGDFDADGRCDLAAYSPALDSPQALVGAGTVYVVRGSENGLTATGSHFFHQDVPGVSTPAEALDHFGDALAAGDLNGDGIDDLAIGVRDEDLVGDGGATVAHGLVQLLYGSPGLGLSAEGAPIPLTRQILGGGTPGDDDRFGQALSILPSSEEGGASRLVVGAPGQTVDGFAFAGTVYVVESLLMPASIFTQNSGETDGESWVFDWFGSALAGGDFNGDGATDLAIGAPSKNIQGMNDAGAVSVFYGTPVLFSDRFEAGDLQAWSSVSP